MFTNEQKRLLDWAKEMKTHPRTYRINLDWRWTDGGKKTAFISQQYKDAGVARNSEVRIFTASVEKFDEKFYAAKRYLGIIKETEQ